MSNCSRLVTKFYRVPLRSHEVLLVFISLNIANNSHQRFQAILIKDCKAIFIKDCKQFSSKIANNSHQRLQTILIKDCKQCCGHKIWLYSLFGCSQPVVQRIGHCQPEQWAQLNFGDITKRKGIFLERENYITISWDLGAHSFVAVDVLEFIVETSKCFIWMCDSQKWNYSNT